MHKTTTTLALLLAATAAGSVHAQQALACPSLPDGAGLHWESRITDGTVFCRALLADGSEAFGLYISPEAGFTPRDPDRLEQGSINGQTVLWYRSEIAGEPGTDARETALELAKDLYVHVWMQTTSNKDLSKRLGIVSRLRFNTDQLADGR